MPLVSKPTSYGLVAVSVIGLIYYFQGEDQIAKKPPAAIKRSKAALETPNDYRREDFELRFDRLKTKPRNLFLSPSAEPALVTGFAPIITPIDKIPATLADGDGNWIFTGIAIVDEKKIGILENKSKHIAENVVEGNYWKNSKIKRISSEGIAFSPKQGGVEQVVLRFNPALEATKISGSSVGTLPNPNQGTQPVNPTAGMVGPIGNMQFQRSRGNPVIVMSGPTP